MLNLRPYQSEGVNEIRNRYSLGYKAPLFVLPTGGGKTVVFSHIAAETQKRGKRVLILVHRVELLRQTSNALNKSGVSHGLINPNYTPNLLETVQVASVQTLVRRLDSVLEPDLIVIDECHHATAGTWNKIIKHYSNAYCLGVTATPIRGDGKGLGSIFDCIVIGPQISELIELGYLVKPRIYAPQNKLDLSDIKIVRGDYDKTQIHELMDKPTITGSAVNHYARICPGVPAVVFCVSIAHAEHVADEFRNRGFKAYSVDGSMDDETRTRILNGLGDGSIEVVTSCDLISEGTDIPAIGCAILLRPTQSTGLYLQQVGRALRTSDNKKEAIILDHVGNVLNHGFPDDYREWSLEGSKTSRKGKSEKNIRVQQCENCYLIHEPAPICPVCGFVNKSKANEIKQVEGELVELTDEQKKEIKHKMRVEVAKASSLQDLKRIEKERGYKRGWANHVYKSRNERLI